MSSSEFRPFIATVKTATGPASGNVRIFPGTTTGKSLYQTIANFPEINGEFKLFVSEKQIKNDDSIINPWSLFGHSILVVDNEFVRRLDDKLATFSRPSEIFLRDMVFEDQIKMKKKIREKELRLRWAWISGIAAHSSGLNPDYEFDSGKVAGGSGHAGGRGKTSALMERRKASTARRSHILRYARDDV